MGKSGCRMSRRVIVIFVTCLAGAGALAEDIINVDTHTVLRTVSVNPISEVTVAPSPVKVLLEMTILDNPQREILFSAHSHPLS